MDSRPEPITSPPIDYYLLLTACVGAMIGAVALTGWSRQAVRAIKNVGNAAPNQGNLVSFAPLSVEAPFYIDDSPPGSYDLTLVDPVTDSVSVHVPAPCPGTITEVGADPAGYGNFLALTCSDRAPDLLVGAELFMAHMASVSVEQGQTVEMGEAIAIQGTTGRSTGEHIHLELTPKNGAKTDRTITRPMADHIVAFWQAGQTADLVTTPLPDDLLWRAIGDAEGTVDEQGNPTTAYHGHTDPGNGANNIGAFSYQHGASSAKEADTKMLTKLQKRSLDIAAIAQSQFGQPLSPEAKLNALDLEVQAPAAVEDYIRHLPSATPTTDQIIDARTQAFHNPQTGQLETTFATKLDLKADQRRRALELKRHL